MTEADTLAGLNAVMTECEQHIARLDEALHDVSGHRPITVKTLKNADKDLVRTLDQALYRFSKLQDAMGLRLVPATLVALQEPFETRPMLDKLNQLEKLDYLESVDNWQDLRRQRNAIAHEYPDAPQVQADNVNHALDAAEKTILVCQRWLAKLRTSLRPPPQ